MLASDRLLRNVLDRLLAAPGGAPVLARRLGMDAALLTGPREKAVEELRDMIKSRVLPQTRLIEVAVTTPDNRLSAELANGIADQFIADEGLAQQASIAETRQTLAREIDELEARLARSQDELNRFLRTAGLLMSGRNDNIQEGQLVQTQTELAAAQAERIRAQARFEQLSLGDNGESLTDVLNDATLRDYRTSLAALRRELADLATTLAPKHYRIQKLRAQIELLEKERDAHQRKIVDRIKNEFAAARRREKLLDGAYRQTAARVTDQTAKGLRYSQLKSAMEANRQIYETMRARLKETEVISAIGTSNLRVVDPAWPAPRPRMPNQWQSAALGLGGGLLASALAAIARRSTAKTIAEPREVETLLQVPAMRVGRTGMAPISRRGTADLNAWSASALEAYAAVAASVEGAAPATRDLTPAAGSTGVEQIAWPPAAEAGGRCYVVSSPGAADGKTVSTAGLGVAMARSGQRVLLVNGDLVTPKLQDLFETDNREGLADLLAEGDLTNLDAMIQPTAVRGLSVLPGGPAVGGTMQLFDSPLLPHLLSRLRDQFDLVLIDTPPLLSSPDARMMAKHADAVILVIRAGHTSRVDALSARQRLASFGLPLGAVVFNDGPRRGLAS